ncbi:hypothetical protein GCM10010272_32010 [Streptomyces lateritius]|nr:hypothetical protein GCM10010272_32010 [Streptomyces lateritius]
MRRTRCSELPRLAGARGATGLVAIPLGIAERPPAEAGEESRTHGRDTSMSGREHRMVKRFDAVTAWDVMSMPGVQ